MSIEPTPFLRGWRSLPDELKLRVLHYAVWSDTGYFSCDFHVIYPDFSAPAKLLRQTVFPLISIPEIKGHVKEAFYAQNQMCLLQHGHPGAPAVIIHPPPSVSVFVRRLRIHTYRLGFESIAFLSRIADGALGLGNVRTLEIVIGHRLAFYNDSDRKVTQEYINSIDEIAFPTRHLHIEYMHTEKFATDEMEMPLLNKLTVKADKGAVKVRWERYYLGFGSGEKPEHVEEWPVSEDVRFRNRITKKVVSI